MMALNIYTNYFQIYLMNPDLYHKFQAYMFNCLLMSLFGHHNLLSPKLNC